MMAQKGKRKKEKIHFHGFTPSHGNQKGEKKLKKFIYQINPVLITNSKLKTPSPNRQNPSTRKPRLREKER